MIPPVPHPVAAGAVVVTRPREKAAPMVEALRDRGLTVIEVPCLGITAPADPAPLRRAVRELAAYDWVAFTSASGVTALAGAGVGPSDVSGERRPRLAAVGPSTAEAVEEAFGRVPDLIPDRRYSAEGLAGAFGNVAGIRGARVLLPLAEAAADLLERRLADLGARPSRVTAYRSVLPPEVTVDGVRDAIGAGRVALLTFTSPSTAENFLDAVGPVALWVPVAAIGPSTADRARELGYEVAVVAEEHTVRGLVEAVARALEPEGRGVGGEGA